MKAMSPLLCYLYLFKDLIRNCLAFVKRRLFGKRVRDRTTVQEEYEYGQWLTLLNRKDWKKFQNIRDYVTSAHSGDVTMACLIDGKVVRAKRSEYYRYRANQLSEIIKKHAHDTDRLIEVGAGAGMNLFSLFSLFSDQLPFRNFVGLDISRNAIQAGREIAAHFGITSIELDRIDLLTGC
jgi:hypothetical protein